MKYLNLIILLIILSGCSTNADETQQLNTQTTPEVESEVQKLVENNTSFAFNLYSQIKDQEGNLIFSPYSITAALAMTYQGAAGATRQEMEQVLNFPFTGDQLDQAFYDLHEELSPSLDTGYANAGSQLRIANSLWLQTGMKFLPNFQAEVVKHYHAGLEQVDFAKNLDAARKSINSWVSKATRGKIHNLLQPSDIQESTRLVLINAIYMKSQWEHPFNPRNSEMDIFHNKSGKKANVVMLHQENSFPYYKGENYAVVELPYYHEKNNTPELAMLIFLPDDDINAFEQNLSLNMLKEALAGMRQEKIALSMPKYKLHEKFNLKDTLEKMGMITAFTPQADLSLITGVKNLSLDKVIHDALISVDENGTEAAAATAVTIKLTSVLTSLPIVFKADHPFVFAIIDRVSGTLLFMGRVQEL